MFENINGFKNYCSNDLGERLDFFVNKCNNDDENIIKITNTGMVSSGKSSLFNVLINNEFENDKKDFFKTGAARTTISANKFRSSTIEYIDTPGIDVKEEDTEIAYKTIMNSDIIMIVHNIKTGPLHRSEAEWLERIVKNIGDTDIIKKRLIFICSWKDTREKDDDYNDAIVNLKELVFGICGTEIPFFEVSVKKYIAGMEKNINKLINDSQINELKKYLNKYVKEYKGVKKYLNAKESNKLLLELKSELINTSNQKLNMLNSNENTINNNIINKKNIWSGVYNIFHQYCNQYLNI